MTLAPSCLRHGERLVIDVDRQDLRAQRLADHHGGQAHTAAAVDRQPFAGLEGGAVDQAAEGGGEPAAHGGGLGEAQLIGELHQVEIGPRHGQHLREGAPAGKTDHVLMVADRGLARPAVRAVAAGQDEGGRDAVTHAEAAAGGARLDHDPCEFMARAHAEAPHRDRPRSSHDGPTGRRRRPRPSAPRHPPGRPDPART